MNKRANCTTIRTSAGATGLFVQSQAREYPNGRFANR